MKVALLIIPICFVGCDSPKPIAEDGTATIGARLSAEQAREIDDHARALQEIIDSMKDDGRKVDTLFDKRVWTQKEVDAARAVLRRLFTRVGEAEVRAGFLRSYTEHWPKD